MAVDQQYVGPGAELCEGRDERSELPKRQQAGSILGEGHPGFGRGEVNYG